MGSSGALWYPRWEVIREGAWDEYPRERGYMCTYSCFTSFYIRNQHSIVKGLHPNKLYLWHKRCNAFSRMYGVFNGKKKLHIVRELDLSDIACLVNPTNVKMNTKFSLDFQIGIALPETLEERK